MVDPSLNTGDDTDTEPDDAATTPTAHRRPRWVKVSAIIIGALVVLFVILQLAGVGPGHGPGMHGGGGTDTLAFSVSEAGGHTPEPGSDHGAQQP